MAVTKLSDAAIAELRRNVSGQIIAPESADYNEARAVYNAMHDRRPLLIVRAAGPEDVAAVVKFAGAAGLPLAIRGGGHSVPGFGTCDDGVVLDLGGLRRVSVDAERRLARAEGGATWGDFNGVTHAFGLATPGGVVSTTGVGGLTLGGGIGYLSRRFGLACDNLLSAQVVTADGELVACSEKSNEDLFWALRGGGGNFGVVTSFEFQLHPVAEIVGGPTFFPLEAGVLQGFWEFMGDAPEELGVLFGLTRAPAFPILPAEWHGKPVAAFLACWIGPAAEGEEVLRPLEQWGPVLGRSVGPMPYPVINTLFDELLPRGLRHYWKSHVVSDLSEEAVATHLAHAARVPTIESGCFFHPIDGACRRVAAAETAFAHRDARFVVGVYGSWRDAGADEDNIAWVRGYDAAVIPFSGEGAYVNFMSGDEKNGVNAGYQQNQSRLVEVKRRYDPGNLFRLNQNIAPKLR